MNKITANNSFAIETFESFAKDSNARAMKITFTKEDAVMFVPFHQIAAFGVKKDMIIIKTNLENTPPLELILSSVTYITYSNGLLYITTSQERHIHNLFQWATLHSH